MTLDESGDEAIFQGLDYKNYYMTDRYIQDESTFECNNISVTYDFRQKWVQQAGFPFSIDCKYR
ncbi:MAG: hypothetical protein ACLU4N_04440 [Butyricimonas faecihominis]